MKIGFGSTRSEKPEAERKEEEKIEKPKRQRLFSRKRSLDVPVEDLRINVEKTPIVETPHEADIPVRTRFTTEHNFKKQEIPSLAEGVVDAGVLVAKPVLDAVEGALEEVPNAFVSDTSTAPGKIHARVSSERGLSHIAGVSEPSWGQQRVAPESVDVHTVPIGWESIPRLKRALRDLVGDRLADAGFAAIKPPPEVHMFLPMVASVIAHRRNLEIPAELPTQEQIKAARPWLKVLELLLQPLSEKAAFGLGRYVERHGERIVQDIAEKIAGFADFVGTIQSPKEQLLRELTRAYKHLQDRQTREGFFGEEEISIEEKITSFIGNLQWAKTHPGTYEDASRWLNSQDFPVLLKIVQRFNFPPSTLDPSRVGVAGAEFMESIEAFLRRHGVWEIAPAPRPTDFDFFDTSTWWRGLAEWWAPEKLQRVKEHLPTVLDHAYEALPSNGPEFRDTIYRIAENICILHKQDRSPSDIVQFMFPGMSTAVAVSERAIPLQKNIVNEISAGATLGVIGGWVAVFTGAGIIWLPVGLIAGALVGGISGVAGMIRTLEKETERKR